MPQKPSHWSQYTRPQLQALADRLFGPSPPLSRWRLELMLDGYNRSMADCARDREVL